ncbi:calcium-binding protein [Ramlibacter terrae]|uniref:Calcium-binding protein n=1 Tax=Ramlibacter terrae TaxID=2732511 RepID=A0ABX6P511_9BURK|nr:calcium-binding protein [Ramlibacter terrae]
MLRGNAGANTLDGGSGADTMVGGSGNDIYHVDNGKDSISESSAGSGGTDTVFAAVDWSAAGQYVENLRAVSGSASIDLTGNGLANMLAGNDGKNILDGGAGADTGRRQGQRHLRGGQRQGQHRRRVEFRQWRGRPGQGEHHRSLAGDYVENLALTGSANINATGNSLANVLTGNAGKNVLNGGTGADTMAGGAGSDIYHVDNAKDSITGESSSSSGGIDSVFSSVSFSLAGDYVEQLALTGSGSINATGNGLANVLTGNAGKNVLKGDAGNDTLQGGAGADSLTGGSGSDRFVYAAASESTTKALDVITDFTRGSDRIDLSHLDGNAGKSGHQTSRSSAAARSAATQRGSSGSRWRAGR